MINVEYQQKLLVNISNSLPKRIEVYAIGGTAMILLGLKESTLDIDLVFENAEDRKLFKDTAISLGFKDSSAEIVYGKKDNTPEMVIISDVRLDLFLSKIITSIFSDEMKQRAKQIHEFGKNLIIKIADIHDILIMKSVTTRQKDEEDLVSILKYSKINWDTILAESQNQIKLGNLRMVMDLGTMLEKIKKKKLADIPQPVLNKLWTLLEKQIKQKKS